MNKKKSTVESQPQDKSEKGSVDSCASEKPASRNADKTIISEKEKFIEKLKNATENLLYISETDAPWEVLPSLDISKEEITAKSVWAFDKKLEDETFEEVSFEKFFAKLTEIKDWFTEADIADANKYLKIKNLFEANLSDLKVFRFGKIQINVYVVGRDSENKLVGLKTKAVET